MSKDRVVTTALSIIDHEGLDAFSMRGLAQELGVYPTAVYWYVPNRNALLAEVVSHALSDVVPPDDIGDWRSWLKELFRRYRNTVRRHPNLAALMGAQLVSNAGVNPAFVDKILTVLSQAGFDSERLVQAFNTVVAVMVGFVTIEFAAAPMEDNKAWAAEMKRSIRAVNPQRHPVLSRNLARLENRAFVVRWQNGTDVPLDDSFEMYIEVTIKGFERLLTEAHDRTGDRT
jgi:AcrR family transcriptional regulator